MGSCVGQLVLANRPLPSSKNPHFQNEAKCSTFLVKMSFICMRMKNHFHIKGWALNLVLIQRPRGTRKLPIVLPRPLLQSQQSLRKLTSPSFPLVSKVRMKRPVSHPETWAGVGGVLFILLVNFSFIWCSYNRSWSQIFASFIQGQSANSRKDNDLRSVIQSREDALREVEKLVKHAESLERKYNEKVWLKQFPSSYRRRCFIIPLFGQAVFMMALLCFDCENSFWL